MHYSRSYSGHLNAVYEDHTIVDLLHELRGKRQASGQCVQNARIQILVGAISQSTTSK